MGQRSTQFNYNYPVATAILLCFFDASIVVAQEVLVDKVVASVDSKPILYSDVERKVEKGPLIIVSDYPSAKSASNREKALNDAINFQMILQKAKELDIEISTEEVEREVQKFLQQKNLTKNGLMDYLKQEGQTYEQYFDDFKSQMVLRRFQGKVIYPQVKVTDKDVETFYLSSSGSLVSILEVTLRQIFIKVDAKSSEILNVQKNKNLKELMFKLKNGLKFEDAVKIYTDDSSAKESGGLMTGIRLKDLNPTLRQAVENLKPGEISDPVLFDGGYRVFELVDRKIGGNQEYLDKKAGLQKQLEMIELENQTNRWLTQQRDKTNIKIKEKI